MTNSSILPEPEIPLLNLKTKSPLSPDIIEQAIKTRIFKVCMLSTMDYNNEREIIKSIYSDIIPYLKSGTYMKVELYCATGGGGNSLIRNLGEKFKWSVIPVESDYKTHKKQAPFERNKTLLSYNPDIVLTFSGKSNPQIEHFINLAYKKKNEPASNLYNVFSY
jgi:hypothetical protein